MNPINYGARIAEVRAWARSRIEQCRRDERTSNPHVVPAIRIDEPGAVAAPPPAKHDDDDSIPFAWLLPLLLPFAAAGLLASQITVL